MTAFRNIKRSFLFERSWRKFVPASNQIEVNDVYVMYALYELGGKDRFVKVKDVEKVMKRNKHTQGAIYDVLAANAGRGYVIFSGGEPFSYKLSVEGVNLLMQLEKNARKERWDR